MLLNGIDLLGVANRNNFAVPAFNISNYAMLNGLFDIAEEKRAPFIAEIHPDELDVIGPDVVTAIRKRANRSSVPIAIHLDHGATYEQVLVAIQAGFTSVMLDASSQPFEDNVAIVKKVAETAHTVGLSVEGELGTIGKMEGKVEIDHGVIYTKPDDAVRFVEETKLDSLAVAIGTIHGPYPPDLKPKLRIDLLQEIKGLLGIPLVLHGGSGNPDEEVAKAVQNGINKVNISSDIKIAYYQKLREVLKNESLREPFAIQPPCIEAMQVVAAHKIDLLGATGKATLY